MFHMLEFLFKENAQFVQKVTFKPLMDLKKKTFWKLEILKKLLLLKVFFTSVTKTQLLFFVTPLFNIFMKQTLTNDFWGLHKIMNSAFPLRTPILKNNCERLLLFLKISQILEENTCVRVSF